GIARILALEAEAQAEVDGTDMKPGNAFDRCDRGDIGNPAPVLDHWIDPGADLRGVLRCRPQSIALAAEAAHTLGLVAGPAHRLLNQRRARGHRHDDARSAMIEEPRHELELLLGDSDQHRHAERIEQLNATKRSAEVPSPMLEIETDPVGTG